MTRGMDRMVGVLSASKMDDTRRIDSLMVPAFALLREGRDASLGRHNNHPQVQPDAGNLGGAKCLALVMGPLRLTFEEIYTAATKPPATPVWGKSTE